MSSQPASFALHSSIQIFIHEPLQQDSDQNLEQLAYQHVVAIPCQCVTLPSTWQSYDSEVRRGSLEPWPLLVGQGLLGLWPESRPKHVVSIVTRPAMTCTKTCTSQKGSTREACCLLVAAGVALHWLAQLCTLEALETDRAEMWIHKCHTIFSRISHPLILHVVGDLESFQS